MHIKRDVKFYCERICRRVEDELLSMNCKNKFRNYLKINVIKKLHISLCLYLIIAY